MTTASHAMCRRLLGLVGLLAVLPARAAETVDFARLARAPFGVSQAALDSGAVAGWEGRQKDAVFRGYSLDVPRDQVVAFALYTVARGQLKLTAQLFPLKQGEEMEARLELWRDGRWREAARAPVVYPGWTAHFRVTGWDGALDVRYRVCHGAAATFEGLVRRDPVEKDEIVVANMSCNGNFNPAEPPYGKLVENLKALDPDLLFFAGDQTYYHTQHTAGWLLFGMQFREVTRNRPTIAIPDDHDVGHGNLWGDGGKPSLRPDAADGGYRLPAAYVNMVQRQQTWHLPDADDPTPIDQGITVYYTRLLLGGIDFAIVEDRKFKSPPLALPPDWPGRPDWIALPDLNPRAIDKPGLNLLGERQMRFLEDWTRDWRGATMKVALSQTAFCSLPTHHGSPDHRLVADLDSNGWPQSGRNAALRLLRRVSAAHLCGDQHLASVVKHGIDEAAEGPYELTSQALRNSIYGRWWQPDRPGDQPRTDTRLSATGNFRDGLGNPVRVLAYTNPPLQGLGAMKESRADGFTLARFGKRTGMTQFECWDRLADVRTDDQPEGWPVRFAAADNDSRAAVAWLPDLGLGGKVVEVIRESDAQTLYVRRLTGSTRRLPVFDASDSYTVMAGADRPERLVARRLAPERPARQTRRGLVR